jgi:hypothetical protein
MLEFRKPIVHVLHGNIRKEGTSMRKTGEYPSPVARVPSRIIRILETSDPRDKELFLQAINSEKQGFGIGAFSYYRTVLQHQKNMLIDRIYDASEASGADENTLRKIREAKGKHRFSEAIEDVSDLIPHALFLGNKNPLKLLHKPLSIGLHDMLTDDDCLKMAGDIRVVLIGLLEKMTALTSHSEEQRKALERLEKTVHEKGKKKGMDSDDGE